MQEWSVKSALLFTIDHENCFNGLKHNITTNWLITENRLLMVKDKRFKYAH